MFLGCERDWEAVDGLADRSISGRGRRAEGEVRARSGIDIPLNGIYMPTVPWVFLRDFADLIQESFVANMKTACGFLPVPSGFDQHVKDGSTLGLPGGALSNF